MKNGIYFVTVTVDFEGPANQWVFLNEPDARRRFEVIADELRKGKRGGDRVALCGPFAPGEDIENVDADREQAVCRPAQEAAERRAAERAAKRKKPAKPADCYAAMRNLDGG